MKHRRRIVLGAVAVISLLIVVWLALTAAKAGPTPTFGIATHPATSGGTFFTAFLTNLTGSYIDLAPILVQTEDEHGAILNNMGETWTDKDRNTLFSLLPQGVAFFSPHVSPTDKNVRVVVEYYCQAAGLQRRISRRIGPIFRYLPQTLRQWVSDRGFVDGRLFRRVEGPWMLNPVHAASGPLTPSSD